MAARGGQGVDGGPGDGGPPVGDWLVPVSRVAGAAGVGWHTAHDAFVGVAEAAGIVVTDPATAPAGRPTVGTADAGHARRTGRAGRAAGGAAAAGDLRRARRRRAGRCPGRCRRSGCWGLTTIAVAGRCYHRDPVTGRWVEDADRWQSVFVDSSGGHGLLGQVEGRTAGRRPPGSVPAGRLAGERSGRSRSTCPPSTSRRPAPRSRTRSTRFMTTSGLCRRGGRRDDALSVERKGIPTVRHSHRIRFLPTRLAQSSLGQVRQVGSVQTSCQTR